jgi:hypothetical protein
MRAGDDPAFCARHVNRFITVSGVRNGDMIRMTDLTGATLALRHVTGACPALTMPSPCRGLVIISRIRAEATLSRRLCVY